MKLLEYVKANQSNTVLFCALPVGAQFVSRCGGVISTKIAAGKSAFANSHSGRVYTFAQNWNERVIEVPEKLAADFRAA